MARSVGKGAPESDTEVVNRSIRRRDSGPDDAVGNPPWPAGNAWNPHPALPGCRLAAAKNPGAAARIFRVERRAVVAREYGQRVLVEPVIFQAVENLSDAPVDLFHRIPVSAVVRGAAETRRGGDRNMRHAVWQIEQERPLAVFADELHRLFRVPPGERGLFHWRFDHFVIPIQPQRRDVHHLHVVAVEQPVEIVESVLVRPVLRKVSQVPFADAGGLVASRFHCLRKRDFRTGDAKMLSRYQHPNKSGTHGISAGKQCRTRRSACRHGVEFGEPRAFVGHAVQARSRIRPVAVTTQVAVAQVVGKQNHEIRGAGFRVAFCSSCKHMMHRTGDNRGSERPSCDHSLTLVRLPGRSAQAYPTLRTRSSAWRYPGLTGVNGRE